MLLLGAGQRVSAQAPVIELGAVKARIIGRVQAQFSTTSVSESDLLAGGARPAAIPATLFETRRVRLGTELEFGKGVTGKIEAEMAMARLQLREAWVNFEIDPAFQLRMGQWKKPFSLMQLTSSTRWPVIERSVRLRGLTDQLAADDTRRVMTTFRNTMLLGEQHYLLEVQNYNNFDLGAGLRGRAGGATYELAVFNGPGSDAVDDNNSKSVAGRVTYKLRMKKPVVLGGAFSTRDFRVRQLPTIESRTGTAFEADVEIGEFRTKGLRVLAEASTGRNLAVADTADHKQFAGAQAIVSWFSPVTSAKLEGWELAGRLSWGDPLRGVDADEGMLLTPGLNLYWAGRNRLMFNWDVFKPAGSQFSTEHALRVQAQIAF